MGFESKDFGRVAEELRKSKVERPVIVHREISKASNPIEKLAIYNLGKVVRPFLEILKGRHWTEASLKLGLMQAQALDKVPENLKPKFNEIINRIAKTAASAEKSVEDLQGAISELERFEKENLGETHQQ